MRSNNSDEDPYIDTRNGFFENLNTGVQYTNKWNDNHTLNFSPKFNRLQYNNTKNIFSQFQLGDSLFNTNARENSFIYKRNIKNNLVYDFKIDPANSLKITTKLNIYNTKSKIYRQSENISKTKLLNNLSDNSSDNNTDKTAFSSSFLFKHKFKKDRRTFSINMDLNILNSDNTGYLYAINKYFDAGNLKQIDTLNQKKNNDNSNKTLSAKAVYTEPLSKKYALEINHEIVRTSRTNNLRTFTSTSNNSNKYDELIDSLTNNFDQQVTINKSGFKISYKHKKVRYSIGNTIGFTHFDLKDITNKKEYKQDFTNIFPSANFQYAYKPNHNFKINYSGRTIQPTISQLQQLRNNNDPLNEFIGNPFLKQSFNHGINLSNISYNFLKEMWVYQSINADVTDNAITNSVIIDKSGKTITQPINMQGSNISVSGWMGAGKKIKKLSLDLNTILQFNYSKFNELINNIKNNNKNASITFGLGIGKTKEKKYDISIQNDLGFNTNRSSIYGKTLQYYTNSLNLSGSAYIKKAWRISTDYELNYREKTDEFSNSVNNNLWNAKLEKTFKNDEFTVFTSINDILNQNIGIDRNFYGNKLTEVRNERLQRFWLVGIRWDFKNKKQTK
ncbi:MAG: outer membrane beta-barrel protein [Chitinophagaceae bacterium]|nr:outer membrane beta-barrel protein [Chitinophagaceae bacterium]